MELEIKNDSDALRAIQRDVALIKNILSDGELTEWAKGELSEARNQDEDTCVSLEDL